MEDPIINRVVNSGLITFNLEDYYQPGERVVIDIRHQLFQELILKEKDFRDFIKQHDWSQYKNKYVAITCTADAIVPQWAFMLVAIALAPYAKFFVFGTLEELETEIFRRTLGTIDWTQYQNAKIVVKGCSKVLVPAAIYIDVTRSLQPFAASLMFGEPCSTVPLYKKPKS
ncbi:hypothetical protein DQQ10_16915 [Pseudochryseolinea flava]|uniref:DUF2480 family protein n=2 Tax=Pseudochryseolinea flava TaxID=2059302 RepID=A0A364XZK9_9BACT|nr:hypothetical protein DQQ10_16915 [Pseudochryseolinea flava]